MSKKQRRRWVWLFLIFFVACVSVIFFAFDMFFSKVNIDTTMVESPKNVSLVYKPQKSISIAWDQVEGAQSYTLYRAMNQEKSFEIYKSGIRENFFEDFNIKGGDRYFYRLTAHKKGYKSNPSLIQSLFTPVEVPQLVASNGSYPKGIKIWWKAVKEAEYYELYRYTQSGSKWELLQSDLRSNHYVDRDVIKGINYYYKVRTVSQNVYGTFSKVDRGFVRLNKPKFVAASDGQYASKIRIAWEKVTGAKYYALYRAVEDPIRFKLLKTELKENYFSDKDARPGTHYYYKVKAFNDTDSLFSSVDRGFVSLKAPIRLQATDASKKRIFVSWERHSDDTLIDLYRSKFKDRGYQRIAQDINEDYYSDTSVEIARTYYYKVKAKKATFSSLFSGVDSGYATIDYPTSLQASDGHSPYHITLSWKSAKVDYFKIFRAEKGVGPYHLIADHVTAQTFTDSNITHCKDYYYKVQSFKHDKSSRISSWDSGYGKCGAFVDTFLGSGAMGDSDGKMSDEVSFNRPTGIVFAQGQLYIADTFNHRIRQLISKRTITIAGSGEAGSRDGLKKEASFYRPTGIAVDSHGNIFVAEVDNHLIRKITPQGIVTTFAGEGKKGDRDGMAVKARFNKPYGIAIDSQDTIYVTELGNHKIRKITPSGEVSTFAGSGQKGMRDGSLDYATFEQPAGIAIDDKDQIYISDSSNNNIRLISHGKVRTFAGSGKIGHSDGKGVAASFNNPLGLAVDAQGNLYVADTGNHKIRMITPKGIVKTVAGSIKSGDKDGFESDAAFFSPRGITLDDQNHIYISDFHAHKIRKITIRTK